jgi:hypothetical protein
MKTRINKHSHPAHELIVNINSHINEHFKIGQAKEALCTIIEENTFDSMFIMSSGNTCRPCYA